ncbi:MAG: hypothetical protein ACE5R3_02555 [Nitrosopumilaceae archaeon]
MNRYHELLDVDRITAEMYGVIIKELENITVSNNGIEKLDDLEAEINSALEMIDYKFFAPSKEKFWEDNLL